MTDDPLLQRSIWRSGRFVLMSGWLLGMVALAGVLVVTLAVFLTRDTVPTPLVAMASGVLGFFTGTMPTLAKEILAMFREGR